MGETSGRKRVKRTSRIVSFLMVIGITPSFNILIEFMKVELQRASN